MFVDVHVHLNDGVGPALQRAEKADVGVVLAAAVDMPTSRTNVSLAGTYGLVRACVGIHPWYADLFTPEAEDALAGLIHTGRVSAISETGIDLVRRMDQDFVTEISLLPLEVQIRAFQKQVRLAVMNNIFLVLHDRGATREIVEVLDQFKEKVPRGIVHGFSGSLEGAGQYCQRGFLISINKRNLPAINPVLSWLDMDQIVVETDSSEPAQVVEVCREVALVKKISEKDVGLRTTTNVQKLLMAKV